MPDHLFPAGTRRARGWIGAVLCGAARRSALSAPDMEAGESGLDHLPDLEAVIRQEAEDAKRDESAMQSFRALRLNQGVGDTVASVLLDVETWRNAEALPEPDARANEWELYRKVPKPLELIRIPTSLRRAVRKGKPRRRVSSRWAADGFPVSEEVGALTWRTGRVSLPTLSAGRVQGGCCTWLKLQPLVSCFLIAVTTMEPPRAKDKPNTGR